MKILFYDVMQDSSAPCALKSPALSDVYTFEGNAPITIRFSQAVVIDSVGIGNCNPGTVISINSVPVTYTGEKGNGLYPLGQSIETNVVSISVTGGTSIGRLALGRAIDVPTAVAKEPGINSTAKPRRTLSGQLVPGLGGYSYYSLSLQSKYKLGKEGIKEIEKGHKYISTGLPFFINLEDEAHKLPFKKLYAVEKNQRSLSLESSIRHYLYSKQWNFKQVF